MFTFDIEVKDRRDKSGTKWNHRTQVVAKTANEAVKQYVVSCKRAHKGQAKSGRRFRAVQAS
jgi:hypothetical protein